MNFAFPEYDHVPASGLKSSVFLFIPCNVPLELGLPELHIGLRHSRDFAALVAMPEAAVHEDDRVPFGEHDVGMAGQFGGMKAVAESEGVEGVAHKHLRLRVLRPNPAHDFAPLLWRYGVHYE